MKTLSTLLATRQVDSPHNASVMLRELWWVFFVVVKPEKLLNTYSRGMGFATPWHWYHFTFILIKAASTQSIVPTRRLQLTSRVNTSSIIFDILLKPYAIKKNKLPIQTWILWGLGVKWTLRNRSKGNDFPFSKMQVEEWHLHNGTNLFRSQCVDVWSRNDHVYIRIFDKLNQELN